MTKFFHIGPGISPRLLYQARKRSWRADMGQGLIPGTIWKISCHNLFITYFALTYIFKLWLLALNWQIVKLRDLLLINLQIFLFRVWFQKDLYELDLKWDLFIGYSWYFNSRCVYRKSVVGWENLLNILSSRPLALIRHLKLNSGANTDVWGMFALMNNQHWLLTIIGHAEMNILQQDMW